MKFLNYLNDFHFFPLIVETVELDTSKADIYKKLKTVTEYPFDLIRSFNVTGDTYKHEYQSEINGDTFKLRRIQKSGYKINLFFGTIIYFRIIKETGNKTIVRYSILFNIFSNLLFMIILFGCIYGI